MNWQWPTLCCPIICMRRLIILTLSSLTAKYNENVAHFRGCATRTNIRLVSSSSPRTSRPSTGSGGSRSLLQRRIKVEAEEVADTFPTSGSSFTASNSGQKFQQLSNSITMPRPANPTYSGRHITAATLSDLDGIDMMNLPVDLDGSPNDPMDINLDEIKLVICLHLLKSCY